MIEMMVWSFQRVIEKLVKVGIETANLPAMSNGCRRDFPFFFLAFESMSIG